MRSLSLVAVVVAVAFVDAAAVERDHLVAFKASDRVLALRFQATLDAVDAALDGTDCTVTTQTRLVLVPVAKTIVPPLPNGGVIYPNVPSVDLTGTDPDQVYVCYKLRCANPSTATLSQVVSQLKVHTGMSLARGGRLLCAPASPNRPCGDSFAPWCNGTCADGEECVAETLGGSGCACVPTPGCGKSAQGGVCGGGNCPSGGTCVPALAPGGCICVPDCGGSAPACQGVCPAPETCRNTGGGTCGCAADCGDLASAQCVQGTCPAGETCMVDGVSCRCM